MAAYRDWREAAREPWERDERDGYYIPKHSSVNPRSEAARRALDVTRALHVIDETDGVDPQNRMALRLYILTDPCCEAVA